MKTSTDILVDIINKSMVEHIEFNHPFDARKLAEAIEENFKQAKKFKEDMIKASIDEFNIMIDEIDADMDQELEKVLPHEAMLKNLIMGQKIACEKLRENVNEML